MRNAEQYRGAPSVSALHHLARVRRKRRGRHLGRAFRYLGIIADHDLEYRRIRDDRLDAWEQLFLDHTCWCDIVVEHGVVVWLVRVGAAARYGAAADPEVHDPEQLRDRC